jgi:hypothetical protein
MRLRAETFLSFLLLIDKLRHIDACVQHSRSSEQVTPAAVAVTREVARQQLTL